jgi:seryl-tRNA synthetase
LLDVRFIRENLDHVRENLLARGARVDLTRLLELDEARRSLLSRLDDVRRQRNELSSQIQGRRPSDAERERGRELKEREPVLESELAQVKAQFDVELAALPNLTRPDVPAGVSEEHNLEVRRWGEVPRFSFEPLDHLALVERHRLVDFEGGAKVAGPKFYFLRDEAVLIEQALVRLALERARARGFTLLQTPDVARRDVCQGTGFNPSGPERQIYTIEGEDLALIGTSEITLSGLHADEILEGSHLPVRYCGLSHCYRVEAGGAGRFGRGLYRVHQFTKVELFAYAHPDMSDAMQQEILAIEEEVFQALELPYRVMLLCGGDAATQSARTYDIEAWMPGRGDGGSYGEVTSASNCTDYQARRLNIRYRDTETKKVSFVHMLNGTAISCARAMVALFENHQQEDGTIRIPKALQAYAGFEQIG